MKLLKYTALTSAIFMVSCQSGENTTITDSTKPIADITLRATSDIQTPSPIKAATFVPNNVATWLGHIILLDDKGTLHRATTDSARTEVVALGKYVDVIGLSRDKKAGVFLALTPQGQIKAFVQTDDEGNFEPLAVSQGNESYERFCAMTTPNGSEIWAITTSAKSQQLAVEIFGDSSVTLTKTDLAKEAIDPCVANNALNLNETYAVKTDNASMGLLITANNDIMTLDVTNGLSIGGINDAGFVSVTSANMGSVYNEGVILVADENEGRLVLISLAYALKELEAR